MSLGYLLCRAADTIADTDIVPLEERVSTLASFKSLSNGFPISGKAASALSETLAAYGSLNKSAEGRLLMEIPACLAELEKRPRTDQALLQNVLAGVINGMEMDLKMFGQSSDTVKAFSTKKDLEQYLLYIGGEPGRFWTQLCLAYFPNMPIHHKTRWIEDGIRFGTGLQMVNILRDLAIDLRRGRCYFPTETLKEDGIGIENLINQSEPERFYTFYHSQIDETLTRLEHGVEYLFQIPRRYIRLRAAVWWPLALGIRTLSKLRTSKNILNPDQRNKVEKKQVIRLMFTSVLELASNRFLERSYRKMAREACSTIDG